MKRLLLSVIITVFFSTLLFSDNAKELYNKGLENFENSNWEDSLYYFKKSLDKNPYYTKALLKIIKVNFKINNYTEADKYIKKLLKADPENLDGLILKAKSYMIKEKYDKALKGFSRVKKMEPMNYEALLGISEVFIYKKNYLEVEKHLKKLLKIDKERVEGYLMYAKLYISRKKYKDAERKLKKGEYYNPSNSSIFFYYGIINEKKNDLKNARRYYEKSYYRDQFNKDVILNLADVYFRLKEWKKAVEFLETSTKEFPDVVLLMNKLALSYQFNNDIDNAIKVFKKTYELNITDDIIKYHLEDLLILKRSFYNQDRKRMARLHFKEAYKADKNFYKYNALYEYRRGLQLHSENSKQRYNLAMLYKRGGFLEKYLKELNISLMLNPSSKSLKDKLEVAENFKKKRMSYKLGIDQYKIKKDKIKIFIPAFSKTGNNYINNQSGKVVADSIRNHLNIYNKFQVITPEKNNPEFYFNMNRNRIMKLAKKEGADYYAFGSIKENSDYLSLKFKLYPVKKDEPIKTFSSIYRGKDKLYYLSKNISKKVNDFFPVSGTIIKKDEDEIIINIGLDENIKKGDKFDIFNKGTIVKDFMFHKYYKREPVKIGTAKVIRIDEQIAKAILEKSSYINKVSINDKVVIIKLKKGKKKQK